MSKSTYTLGGITDTNSHDLPDTDGDDKAESQGSFNGIYYDKLGVFITNHADTALTARLERSSTLDENMDMAATDIGSVSVPAGGTEILSADETIPYGYFRVVFSYDTVPTSTDPSVTVHFQGE